MKHLRLFLSPDAAEGVVAPVATSKPTAAPTSSRAAASPRQPTASEKSIKFSVEDSEDIVKGGNESLKPTGDGVNVDKIEEPTRTVEPVVPAEVIKPKVATTPKIAKQEPIVITPIAPKTSTPAKEFDYTGFTEPEIQVLKQMSTSAKDFTIKLIKENKELATNKNSQFMQHPNAFTLDPDYNKLQEDVFYYNKETEYWQEQLTKVKAGEQWSPIKGWTKNGEPVADTPRNADAASEEQIRLMMNRCYNATEIKQQELKQFTTNYKNRITADQQAIQQERAQRFGWVSDPKILDSKIEMENGFSQTVGEVRNTFISLFPPYMRTTSGVEVAADLFAALQIFGQENRELKQGKQIAEVKAEEITRAEPTSRKSHSKPVAGQQEFSMEGLPD